MNEQAARAGKAAANSSARYTDCYVNEANDRLNTVRTVTR